MTEILNLNELDMDGAIRESADKLDGSTRASFLRKAGVGAGAVLGSGAILSALAGNAAAAGVPQSDINILNFALTLEYLEGAFYAEAVAKKALKGETLRFATVVAQHEATHIAFLKKVLGAKAVASPKFNFKDTTSNQAKFEATADALENTGVHAYLGQVPNIKTPAVLLGAGRILPIEARHASWIRDIRFSGGPTTAKTPAPGAFEDGFSMAQVLAIVKGTGFIVG